MQLIPILQGKAERGQGFHWAGIEFQENWTLQEAKMIQITLTAETC